MCQERVNDSVARRPASSASCHLGPADRRGAERRLGRAGLIIGTAVAGFADSQSAAISAGTLTHTGDVTATTAAVATLSALTTDTLSKAALAAGVGRWRYALAVWPGLALILAGARGGFAITRLA